MQSVLQATSHDLGAGLSGSSGGNGLVVPGFTKRQGVSGESSDQHHLHHKSHANKLTNQQHAPSGSDFSITTHDKDFRYVCVIGFY